MPVKDNFTIPELRTFFAGWVNLFKRELKVPTEIRVDEQIAYDVLHQYVLDRKRIQDFNHIPELESTKCQACLAFWIRKLKPLYYFSESDPKIGLYLNELFGLLMAVKYCSYEKCRPVVLDPRFLSDMLFQFRYKSVSPHSLNMVLQGIFTDFKLDKTLLV